MSPQPMAPSTTFNLKSLGDVARNSRRVLRMIWENQPGLILSLSMLILLTGVIPFIYSWVRGRLINELILIAGTLSLDRPMTIAIVAFLLVTIFPPFIHSIQNYFGRLFWFRISEIFDLRLVQKKGEIDVASHENPKEQDLLNKVYENGVWRVQNFGDRLFDILESLISVGAAAVVLSLSAWWMFPVLLAGTIPELFIEMTYGRTVWNIHSGRSETRRRYWDIHRHFNTLPNLIELKLFQNTRFFFNLLRNLYDAFIKEELANERSKIIRQLLTLGLSQIVVAFIIFSLIRQVVDGSLLIGTLTFFLASISDMRKSLSVCFMSLGRQFQDSLFISDLFTFLDLKTTIPKPISGIIRPATQTPTIQFDHVDFAYPGTHHLVLTDLSLTIRPGEKVALVGVNGAGKTTIVKLLCRFYDPTAGRILLDGVDLRDLDLESWYDQLGALFQDYAHYQFLAKNVIGIGRTNQKLSMPKVFESAKWSESNAFIEAWEKKYDQMIGKGFTDGVEPSTGQWQKLALARTFYRDARVMILDEPTSSIDAESEARIFEKLEELPKDRSVVLISHRFSTVRHADTILILDRGQITERGTHEELLKLNGTYARLFQLQARGYQ